MRITRIYPDRFMRQILLTALLVCSMLPFFAGNITFNNSLTGSGIAVNAVIPMQDQEYFKIQANLQNFADYNLTNLVRLSYRGTDKNAANFATSTWTLTVGYTIRFYNNTNQLVNTLTGQSLKIFHNAAGGTYSRDVDLQKITGAMAAYKFDVQVTSVTGSSGIPSPLSNDIYLESEINTDRYYTLTKPTSAYTAPVLKGKDPSTQVFQPITGVSINSTSGTKYAELEFTWPYIVGAEEYEFEWVYSFFDITQNGGIPASPPTADFSKAARITTPDNFYRINLLYEQGYIQYRFRPVSRRSSDINQPLQGDWSLGGAILIETPHNTLSNWSYGAAYAEDGKKKEVASYFDYSLRKRQMVTRNNSDNTSLVTETMYDFEGRPAVSILPTVPGTGNDIKYYDNYSLSGTAAFDKKLFGSTQARAATQPYANLDAGDAGTYYKAKTADMAENFLPDAENVPYTQTVYNNEGQVKTQTGLGKSFALGSGHESNFYSASPSQFKLDRLFGNEVGSVKYYRQETSRDANGQLSVSYLDLAGKTIATALVGNPLSENGRPLLESLSSNSSNNITDSWDGTETFDAMTQTWENKKPFFVSTPGVYNFTVTIGNTAFSHCSGNHDCVYDLDMSLSDPCGNQLTETSPGSPAILGTIHTINVASGTQQYIFSVNFPDVGTYTFTKKLALNAANLSAIATAYKSSLLDLSSPCVLNGPSVISSGLAGGTDLSGCTECTDAAPCPEVEDCGLLLDILKKDLKPNGQYAENLPLGTTTASNTWLTTWVWNDCVNPENPAACQTNAVWLNGNMYNMYNSLITNWSTYKTNFDNGFLTVPFLYNTTSNQTLDPSSITNYDSNEFESLVEFHPEYCHYEWCELMDPSRSFDANLTLMNSVTAEASGNQFLNSSSPYMTSTTINNILAADPFFHSGTTPLTFHPSWATNAKNLSISSTVLSSMTTVINSGYYSPTSSVLSMWQQAVYVVTGNASPSSLSILELEQAWHTFVGYYVYEKTKITEQYKVNTFGCPYLYDANADGYADAPVATYSQPLLEIFNKSAGFAIRVPQPVMPSIPTIQSSPSTGLQNYADGVCGFNAASLCEQLASYSINYSAISLSTGNTVKVTCELPSSCVPVTLPAGATPIPNPIVADVTNNVSGGVTISTVANAWNDIATNINSYNAPSFTYGYTKGSNSHDGFKVVACVDATNHTITFYPTAGQGADFNGAVIKLYVNGSLVSTVPSTAFSGGSIDNTSAACSNNTNDLNCFCAQIANLKDDYSQLSSTEQAQYSSNIDYVVQTLNASYGTAVTITNVNGWIANCNSSKSSTTYDDYANWPGQTPETVVSTDANSNQVTLSQTVPQALRCYEFSDPCQQDAATINDYYGNYFFNQNIDQLVKQYISDYSAHCLGQDATPAFVEHTKASYTDNEYHYTLYYYDRAGNLTRTVPPKAVKPLSATDAQAADTYRNSGTGSPVLAAHAGRNVNTISLSSNVLTRNDNTNTTATNTADDPNLNLCDGTSGVYHYNSLVTSYVYNSYNQPISQTTPDAGTTTFWYDKKGKLMLSQNQEQYSYSGNSSSSKTSQEFSYTLYDNITRVVEVGKYQATAPTALIQSGNFYPLNAPSGYSNYLLNFVSNTDLTAYITSSGTTTEITRTKYDDNQVALAEGALGYFEKGDQLNTRNRVTATERYSDPAHKDHSTFYSYDEHGNVRELVQKNAKLYTDYGNLAVKKTVYDYDLVSGKVNKVTYQPNEQDQYIHRYAYDAENRLRTVYTSKDGLIWDRDADYFYYKHGPLARVEIGDKKVQGLDYAYTIQGWIKGVNSALLNAQKDPGRDAYTQNSSSFSYNASYQAIHRNIGQDAMGYALQYFNGEYKPVSDAKYTASTDRNTWYFLSALPGSATTYAGVTQNLYNGNISAMTTGIYTGAGLNTASPLLTAYSYDQLNRIVKQNAFFDVSQTNNNWTGNDTQGGQYKMELSYDPMGNITHLLRNGINNSGHVDMDDLSYNYLTDNTSSVCFPAGTTNANKELNKLGYVQNNAAFTQNQSFTSQSSGNYSYDAIGNLVKDTQEGIDKIDWDVYGKIKAITYATSFNKAGVYPPNLQFIYDASGQRVAKIKIPRSASGVETDPNKFIYDYYVRDAQGNTMAIYESTYDVATSAKHLSLIEHDIYGSARLGTDLRPVASDNNPKLIDNNSFTATTENWTTNSVATYDAATQRLKAQVTTQYAGPDLVLTTSNGTAYDISYQLDKSANPSDYIYAEVYDVSSGALILSATECRTGINYLSFTAKGTQSRLRLTKGNASGTSVYYVDNVMVKQALDNRLCGLKTYELSNHLGNVLTVVSDNLMAIAGTGGVIDHYTPDKLSATDYYAFGEAMPGRQYASATYRYAMNGQEKDDVYLDLSGMPIVGASSTAEYWEYDGRLGRRWNIDPVLDEGLSPYATFANNPILMSDPNGDSPGVGGPPEKQGTKEGETAQTTYFPACKECTEYRTEDWIWHEGGVNGSKAGWMAPDDYQREVLNPVTDAYIRSQDNPSDMESYDMYLDFITSRSGGGDWRKTIKDYSVDRRANPTYDSWMRYLPIWGSYKQAKLDFSVGKYGWGTFNSLLAASDIFLVKSLLFNGGKFLLSKTAGMTLNRTIGFGGADIAMAKLYISNYTGLTPGFTNVVMHGSVLRNMSFLEFDGMLAKQNVHGNIRLWICNAGEGFHAQALANWRGIAVEASEFKITVRPSGFQFLGNAKEFSTFRPK
ncbi:MAG: hypothetical protein JST26_17610 [Bacteroidetes bacterium]|nr:hypothetical protein [Bacteroidota bacterium]